jgi:large conductance mechanosensitive channel
VVRGVAARSPGTGSANSSPTGGSSLGASNIPPGRSGLSERSPPLRGLLNDFKAFAIQGNLLEIAVAFVLGVAFAAVVNSFVNDIVMNLIAAVVGKPDFSDLTFSIGDGVIRYGSFLTAVITFLLIAFVLFLIIQAVQRSTGPKVAERKDCPHCLSSIPVGASVCSACTRDLAAVPGNG